MHWMEFSRSWHLPGVWFWDAPSAMLDCFLREVEMAEVFPLKALKGWWPVVSGASGVKGIDRRR